MSDTSQLVNEAPIPLTIGQVGTGDTEAAKQTAALITDELQDLRAVKETVLSLSGNNLWIGSWVHDLVLNTAKSGDIDGALTYVSRMPEDSPRGHFLSLIAAVQAQHGDYRGAKSTIAALEPGNPWRDIGLIFIIREMMNHGDQAEAYAIANRIVDPQIKTSAMRLCTASSTTPSS